MLDNPQKELHHITTSLTRTDRERERRREGERECVCVCECVYMHEHACVGVYSKCAQVCVSSQVSSLQPRR